MAKIAKTYKMSFGMAAPSSTRVLLWHAFMHPDCLERDHPSCNGRWGHFPAEDLAEQANPVRNRQSAIPETVVRIN
jgi:hypothetical protein